jgi:hypothetical protein
VHRNKRIIWHIRTFFERTRPRLYISGSVESSDADNSLGVKPYLGCQARGIGRNVLTKQMYLRDGGSARNG